MAGVWRRLLKSAVRRNSYDPAKVEDTRLKRCLSRWEVGAIGVGSTLGVGLYAIIGHVALTVAGPAIVLSFLLAAVAALLAGLCFGEFSARAPRAGAAYCYTHVAFGEIVAFMVGWCNILEFLFGSASVAKGLSLHMDGILNHGMSEWFANVFPIAVSLLSPFFDFFACAVVLIMGVILSFGVREASSMNLALAAVNLAMVTFIVAVGAFAADSGNWSIPLEEVPLHHGKGGFFPFGVWGALRGAAYCFFGFVGFDSICAAGEEMRSPRRMIPMTIVYVILLSFVCYAGVAVVVTMMVPYYLQVSEVAVSEVFAHVGWYWARRIVQIGSLFGLYAGLFGAMFPLPRLLYSMSSDGLLCKWFSHLTECRQSPAIATILPTLCIAILAGVLDLETLLATLCTGTLLSYTAVACGVIVIRFRSDYTPGKPKYLRQIFGIGRSPTLASARIVYVTLTLFISVGISAALILTYVSSPLIPSVILNTIGLVLILIMTLQPHTKEDLPFKTPLVPLIPCLSIYFNIHLMAMLNWENWLRLGVWFVIGLIIYLLNFCCCKKQDKLKNNITVIHESQNGKGPVKIIVESPSPPDTIARSSINRGDTQEVDEIQLQRVSVTRNIVPIEEEIVLHQAYVENSEEKEAKIIDLLDQVLQAEEDAYGEVISLKELQEDEVSTSQETPVHRKSLSELSDAGSDASMGIMGLSKYDVIAQVHREDLSKVDEEEVSDNKDDDRETEFNDNDSRTDDESGYSDTIDRTNESLGESKEDIPHIPVPPPLPDLLKPMPDVRKSYTIPSVHSKPPPLYEDDDEEIKPRESIKSNNSLGEDNITFGSDRQVHFMSKLNTILQPKKPVSSDEDEPKTRLHSTENLAEKGSSIVERPSMLLALQNEISSKEAAQNLRPVNVEETPVMQNEPEEEEDQSLNRKDLKTKLEGIFAVGGPQLIKPRLIKSNPPTPEDSYQFDTSSSESIAKLPKIEKNDTLKRQKDKFSAVLNSFRQSFKDDDVV